MIDWVNLLIYTSDISFITETCNICVQSAARREIIARAVISVITMPIIILIIFATWLISIKITVNAVTLASATLWSMEEDCFLKTITSYYQAESIKSRVRVCTPVKKDEGDSKSVSHVDHIGRRNSVDARFLYTRKHHRDFARREILRDV